MAKPDLVEGMAVQVNALHVFVFMRSMVGKDHEILPIREMDGGLVKDWAAHFVDRNARGRGIEAEHGKDDKGAQAAAIFVARNALQGIGEERLKEHANSLLCLPRCAEVVVDIRDGKAWFIAHRKLACHGC